MTGPILNIDTLEYDTIEHGEAFHARMGQVGQRIGASKLGYNLTVIPPGKRAFPRHSHYINEEMFFVLSGVGEIRIGATTHPLREGDVVACPPGGPETAHQIRNTSDSAELRFLAVSTRESPEIVEYPDSGKFGVRAVVPTAAEGPPAFFQYMGRLEDGLDYWEGE